MNASKGPPNLSLLQRCQSGEQAAWNSLFKAWAQPIFRWSVFLGLSSDQAEEVVQEVFMLAARKIDTCHSDAAIYSWLFGITRHLVANRRRLAWVRKMIYREDIGGVDAASGDEEEMAFVRNCVKQLPLKQQEVLLLCDIEGHTRDEAASLLALAPGTVASRLRLARQGFARIWEQKCNSANN